MNLEGKIAGYNKKTVIYVVAIIIAVSIVFYAGAKYEKSKLTRMGLLGNKTDCSTQTTLKATTGKKKNKDSSIDATVIATPTTTITPTPTTTKNAITKVTASPKSTNIQNVK